MALFLGFSSASFFVVGCVGGGAGGVVTLRTLRLKQGFAVGISSIIISGGAGSSCLAIALAIRSVRGHCKE